MNHVDVTVGLIDEGTGIGVNVPRLSLSKPAYVQWLTELLGRMGFRQTKAVQFKKNDFGQKVDWRRLRISADECEMQGVDPEAAVARAGYWFSSRAMWREYGIHFRLIPEGYQLKCFPDCECSDIETHHQSLRTTSC